ncbi:DUF2189 domain-containing protein [Pararhizobium mangrovi]|uniref:DUF2189 domain-containing protein n=1 Tax=Pararhizobium mangrovi TaxID=2590452 RepID=A0A506U1D4_9HYPH|nr:DUF2189 domain-containing protein [Pararhizobium mangrovi]TPW26804.1 DUF2189 domain-containing protein [Pararhizobium mangrovi]
MANFHVLTGASDAPPLPEIRGITRSDVFDALRLGTRDFLSMPTHAAFICLIYPVVGLVLGVWAEAGSALSLVFPLISGFALLGPIAALGLYEISRRREMGRDPSWQDALEVARSPALPSIVTLGACLFAVFLVWLLVAQALYVSLFGARMPETVGGLLAMVFSSGRGLVLLVLGNAIGFAFAAFVLATTAIAFPLLLDRDVGMRVAVLSSIRASELSPRPMALWGLIVAVMLVLGSIPFLVGLAVVLPILGHATWHLYRKTMPRSRR